MLQDIQFAVRRVLRAPAFSLGIIVILGAGIGATTAMVSVLDALMYRPVDVPRPDTLISVETISVQGVRRNTPFAAFDLLSATELHVDGWCGNTGTAIDPTEASGTPMPAAVEFVTGGMFPDYRRRAGVGSLDRSGRCTDSGQGPVRGGHQPSVLAAHVRRRSQM